MNVLDATRTPRGDGAAGGAAGLARSSARGAGAPLATIGWRRSSGGIEILDGYLLVYLNLDEVIRIIREEDEPKPRLMQRFKLTDVQAEAILNMRLRVAAPAGGDGDPPRSTRRLSKERKEMQALLKNDRRCAGQRIADELEQTRKKFGSGPLGDRRTELGAAPPAVEVASEAFVEREPITVILSDKGWIRAVKGHIGEDAELSFKEGDRLKRLLPCQTTDRLMLFATNGRAYTLKAADLPRGRGDGQPVRLMAELTNEDDVAALFVPVEGARYLVASTHGRGFVVPAAELAGGEAHRQAGAEPETGRGGGVLRAGRRRSRRGDRQNRKLLVFPLEQVPEMARGGGVILQRYKDGGLADAKVFRLAEGLTWRLGEKVRTETNLRDWLGERAQAGRMPPNGFPRSGKFA